MNLTHGGMALPRGYELNEYRIESTLGVGGFGLTYLAVDSNLARKVAIKEYLPGELASRGPDHSVQVKSDATAAGFKWGRARFLEESRTLASFRHANIVRVMRFFEANQTAYMVMEFVEGQSMNDWIVPHRPLSEDAVLALTGPLLDFGSARAAIPDTDLTAIVTPGYAPLEQYHAQGRQGPWSDLYSVGAVLYWAVIGHRPFDSTARGRNDPLIPALQAGDPRSYSPALLKAIDWALTPHEEARPQSVAALRQALPWRESPSSGRPTPSIPASSLEPTLLASTVPSRPGGNSHTIAMFDRDILDQIEADLVSHVGPIAPLAVRSAARKVTTLAGLIELLSNELPEGATRAAFVRKYAEADRLARNSAPVQPIPSAPAPGPAAGAGPGAAAAFEATMLARAEALLANYLGAVARVVVRRAAARARDEAELYLLIADEIEDKDEKKAFIRKAMSVARQN